MRVFYFNKQFSGQQLQVLNPVFLSIIAIFMFIDYCLMFSKIEKSGSNKASMIMLSGVREIIKILIPLSVTTS